MTSISSLATRANATSVTWLELSGINLLGSDGYITASNVSTLFSDAYTPTLSVVKLLGQPDFTFSRSLEIFEGTSEPGGFEISLVDVDTAAHPDGYLTWLFGSERSTILTTQLAADVNKHAGVAGHNWTVVSSSSFPASGTIYCGLDTASYASKADATHFTTVTRSVYKAPATAHRTDTTGAREDVTDHPTVWKGRIVTFFQTFAEGGGLAGTTATARSVAHKVRGVLRDVSFDMDTQTWKLRCDSIMTLLDRKVLRTAASATVQHRINALAGVANALGDPTLAPVLKVGLVDMATPATNWFTIQIATGAYTHEEFISAINEELANDPVDNDGNNTWEGEMSLSLEDDSLLFAYSVSAGAGQERAPVVSSRGDFDPDGGPPQPLSGYWSSLGLETPEFYDAVVVDDTPTSGESPYELRIARVVPEVNMTTNQFRVQVEPDEGWTLNDFDDNYGDVPGNTVGVAVVRSSAGEQIVNVKSVDAADGSLLLGSRASSKGFVHTGDITIQRAAFFNAGTANHANALGSGMLRLLLSTGLSGYNDANYDTLVEGVGAEMPHETPGAGASSTDSLINLTAFERFFHDCAPYYTDVQDIVTEPTPLVEILKRRVAFFGGYLTVEDGQITVRRCLNVLKHEADAAITTGPLLGDGRGIVTGQAPTIDSIVWRYDWRWGSNEYWVNVLYTTRDTAATPSDSDTKVIYEDKGVRTDAAKLESLATEILSDFKKQGWIYNVSVDRALFDLEPGHVVTLTDEGGSDTTGQHFRGMPNPDGTRGHSGTRMLVLEASTDFAEGKTELSLLKGLRNNGGIAASGWVRSFTNVGQCTLTLEANLFSDASEGTDASRFSIGDKVSLKLVNTTRAGTAALPDSDDAGESGLTIANVSGNQILLTTTINAAWVSGTSRMVLVHDQYETANQTTTAQSWTHVGEDTGVIDGGSDPCYDW